MGCLLVLLALASAGCGDHRVFYKADAWYSESISSAVRDEPPGTKVNQTLIHPVAAGEREAAVAALREVTALPLSEEKAAALVGHPLVAVKGTKPYLVRAVILEGGEESIRVTQAGGGSVLVYDRTMGHSPGNMVKYPLVLQLERPPRGVVLSVSRDE